MVLLSASSALSSSPVSSRRVAVGEAREIWRWPVALAEWAALVVMPVLAEWAALVVMPVLVVLPVLVALVGLVGAAIAR